MQTIAQRYSPEVHAAVLLSLESPSGYVFAVLIGEELVNAQVVLGGMIVFAGVVITELEAFISEKLGLYHKKQ
jgi:drug/metabolite transporter (DMT)-like permease